jgi:hypothetical protein
MRLHLKQKNFDREVWGAVRSQHPPTRTNAMIPNLGPP